MTDRPSLRLVDDDGVVHEQDAVLADLADKLEGYRRTVEKQAREIGVLTRRIAEDEDPHHHPQGREIVALIERWKLGAGHPKSKTSADRVKFIKARLKDDFTIEQLELAIDGIAAFPYVGTGGQRFARGKPSQRYDRLGIALGGGEAVEKFAVLGHQARSKGWTPSSGWPS